MHGKMIAAFIVSVGLLAGCQRSDNTTSPPAATTASSEQPPAAPKIPAKGLSADPGVVRVCDVKKGISAQLGWDVSDSGAEKVVLYVTNPRTKEEKRYGHGGPIGTKRTGPWLRPGMIFTVRDQATGKDLASTTIEGALCH